MVKRCTHLDQIQDVTPSANGCEDCLRIGDTWVHLRLCLTCGHVGCCDDSKNKHATRHFHATNHPIIQYARAWRGLGLVLHRSGYARACLIDVGPSINTTACREKINRKGNVLPHSEANGAPCIASGRMRRPRWRSALPSHSLLCRTKGKEDDDTGKTSGGTREFAGPPSRRSKQ